MISPTFTDQETISDEETASGKETAESKENTSSDAGKVSSQVAKAEEDCISFLKQDFHDLTGYR